MTFDDAADLALDVAGAVWALLRMLGHGIDALVGLGGDVVGAIGDLLRDADPPPFGTVYA